MTRTECETEPAALCMPCLFEKRKGWNKCKKRVRSGLSDEQPSESHSALFHMRGLSTPQGIPALCKVHQKTNSFSVDLKWGLYKNFAKDGNLFLVNFGLYRY